MTDEAKNPDFRLPARTLIGANWRLLVTPVMFEGRNLVDVESVRTRIDGLLDELLLERLYG